MQVVVVAVIVEEIEDKGGKHITVAMADEAEDGGEAGGPGVVDEHEEAGAEEEADRCPATATIPTIMLTCKTGRIQSRSWERKHRARYPLRFKVVVTENLTLFTNVSASIKNLLELKSMCCYAAATFNPFANTADYHSIAVPPKYRAMGSFWKYYAGIALAPVLTIFIGGNHEASQPLSELLYGGWVAPNIYYLGAAGVVRVGGIRIGGLSGIFKSHDYSQGRYEQPPYDRSSIRSIYHVRNLDVYRMNCLTKMDIMLSHDWPQGIEQYGNTESLLRQKPFFAEEIRRNDLGSLPNWEVLQKLKPKWWFSAHLHVKFAAQVLHTKKISSEEMTSTTKLVPSQVSIAQLPQLSSSESAASEVHDASRKGNVSSTSIETTKFVGLESSKSCVRDDLTDQMTRFLSLDKCLPRRQYLSILHVPACSSHTAPTLEYDVEWLAILKRTHSLTVAERCHVQVPNEMIQPSQEELDWIRERFEGSFEIPTNFAVTVPPYSPGEPLQPPLPRMGNPQTDHLLRTLNLQHVVTVPYQKMVGDVDENEIDLDEIESPCEETETSVDDQTDGKNDSCTLP